MSIIDNLLILPLAVAAISVTITKGKIFRSLRIWLSLKSKWLWSLLSCPYCMSHWVSLILLIITPNTKVDIVPLFSCIGASAIIIGIILKLLSFSSDDPHIIEKLMSVIKNKKHEN